MLRYICAHNLRRQRQSRGLTQAELAQAAEIGLATLARIERAEISTTLDTLEALCHVLDIEAHALLKGDDLQKLIIAIQYATHLDALATAINDLADYIDRLELDSSERSSFYDLKIDHVVDWTELPTWGRALQNPLGIFSWDDTRYMTLDRGRAELWPREDEP